MNTLDVIADAAESTGYRKEAIIRDFAFADVLDPRTPTRHVALAAFTRTPPSYRSAALAAVPANTGETATLVDAHRALGAPLLFVIGREDVSLWQVRDDTPRRLHAHIPLKEVPALFKENRRDWHPDAIHRAKSIGAVDQSCQLDFVDLGLLPAVEGEIHAKLDRLLVDMLDAAAAVRANQPPLEPHLLFHVVFRLLAAKVLRDRRHPCARLWDTDNLALILRDIESYYSLPAILPTSSQAILPALLAGWETLCKGINFSNISADDLAFVYENTLVSPDTRLQFGTHSTPRQLAEYAVSRLGLHHHRRDELRIYEPFAGAGVFLVSALRHLRDLLPTDWDDAKRHDFLVKHLSGDEIDAFACEVATLSLILADYPNRNGWRIFESDLLRNGNLSSRLATSNIVLCNPPFQDFTDEERSKYRISVTQYSKPVEILDAALDAGARALAFVLPRAFILHRKFAKQRQRLEEQYRDLEIVELPDRIFRASRIESSLLVAKEPRQTDSPPFTVLRSTVVSDGDRAAFLNTGQVTTTRVVKRPFPPSDHAKLWIPALRSLWEYLGESPCLGNFLTIHRGIEWQRKQPGAWAVEPRPGYQRGLHTARHTSQYALPDPVWLDCRKDRLRRQAFKLPWATPKLVANSARLSRGAWRIGAALDTTGLVCSQQFFCFWPRKSAGTVSLEAFAALLNGPVANAFLAVQSPEQRMRISAVKRIPVPMAFPESLAGLVKEYIQYLRPQTLMATSGKQLNELLVEIDATVLQAYDLPPRLEHELLSYFPAKGRPVTHDWQHWNHSDALTGLTLAERLSLRYEHNASIGDIFAPLPPEEAAVLRTYWT